MNDANKALVITAYQRGHAVATICEAAGISTRTLYRLLAAEGIALRGQPAVPRDALIAQQITAELLMAHEAKQWLSAAEVVRRIPDATEGLVTRVRVDLQRHGWIGRKRDYVVCYRCGKPAVARSMCNTHYREARHAWAQMRSVS